MITFLAQAVQRSLSTLYAGTIFVSLATGCSARSAAIRDPRSSPTPIIATPSEYWVDSTRHRPGFVSAGDGTRLHYLDFGGSGDTIIMLTGTGDNAHIFDFFAPMLAKEHYVIALTRRGFGESDKPLTGYNRARLATDIRDAMDQLHIARAVIVGHSIAGEEMTRFAAMYPDRLRALVYLEAAYDRIQMMAEHKALPGKFPVLPDPDPTRADSASIVAYAAYWTRVLRFPFPPADIWATTARGPRGEIVTDVTPDSVSKLFQAALEPPNYAAIHTPALAIYAVDNDTISTRLRATLGNDPATIRTAEASFAAVQHNHSKQRERFRTEVAGAQVIEIHGADHYVFMSHPAEVIRGIRAFLNPR